jgi:hypothetical protein
MQSMNGIEADATLASIYDRAMGGVAEDEERSSHVYKEGKFSTICYIGVEKTEHY